MTGGRVDGSLDDAPGQISRPAIWPCEDRHILVGVSHASDNPARHRVFEIRAVYDAASGGWVARVGEQNFNEQRGAWGPNVRGEDVARVFATPSSCFGNAVAAIVAAFDVDAEPAPTTAARPMKGTQLMQELLEQTERQKKVTIHEPEGGWSADWYRRELAAYGESHGRAPQTVTMHPDTMERVGVNGDWRDANGAKEGPTLVTSRDYDRATITLYY